MQREEGFTVAFVLCFVGREKKRTGPLGNGERLVDNKENRWVIG